MLLRELGLDPASDPARRVVGLVRDCVTWKGCGPQEWHVDGRWPLDVRYPGQIPVEIDEGEGRSSRWITLRALPALDCNSARD